MGTGEGVLDLSLVAFISTVPFSFFQTVNILSINAVYPKTFLDVLKHTQKPKGVARLVTPVGSFYCMLPQGHVSIITEASAGRGFERFLQFFLCLTDHP